MKLVVVCLLAICVTSCKKSKAPPAATASGSAPIADAAAPDVAPPADAVASTPDAEPMDCDMICTEYALCWEAENPGEDFRGGGQCVRSCEERDPEARADWFAAYAAAKPSEQCKVLMAE